MRNLNLTEMECINGGNGCSNGRNSINAAKLATWALAAVFVASTGGAALWVVGAIWVADGYYNCL